MIFEKHAISLEIKKISVIAGRVRGMVRAARRGVRVLRRLVLIWSVYPGGEC
jgi:hypothetical protein